MEKLVRFSKIFLILYVCFIPLTFIPNNTIFNFSDVNTIKNFLVTLFVFLFFLLYFCTLLLGSKTRLSTGISSLDYAIIIFFGWNIVSYLHSSLPKLSSEGLFNLIVVITPYFFITRFIKNEDNFRLLTRAWILCASLFAIIGVLQCFHLFPPMQDLSGNPDYRAMSTLGHHNFSAAYLLLSLAPTLYLLLHPWHKLDRYISTICLPIIIIALILTGSLCGWLGFTAGITTFTFFWLKTSYPGKKFVRPLFIFITLVVLFFIVWGSSFLLTNFLTAQQVRLETWKSTMEYAYHYPLMGSGPGTYSGILPSYKTDTLLRMVSSYKITALHAHNEFLELLAETGIPGLLSFIAIIFLLAKEIFRYAHEHENKYIPVCFMAGITAILTQNLASVSLRQPVIAFYFWLSIGCLTSILVKNHPNQSITTGQQNSNLTKTIFLPRKIKPAFTMVLGMILALVGTWVAWKGFNSLRADYLTVKAAKYKRENRLIKALETYEKSLGHDPSNPRILYKTAYVWLTKGQELSRTFLPDRNKAINIGKNEDITPAYCFNRAIQLYQESHSVSPNYYNVHYNLGICYELMGDYIQATEEYEKSLQINPYYLRTYVRLSRLKTRFNQLDEARNYLQQALLIDPSYSLAKTILINMEKETRL